MRYDAPTPPSLDLAVGDRSVHFEPIRRADGAWDDSALFAVVDGALLSVSLYRDGTSPTAADVSEVTNVDDDPSLVEDVNAHFGTSFTRAQFPGR